MRGGRSCRGGGGGE
uniref:Uncharacterized protein n=1 Tax=Arundo donax TaxID=35708 RepID=A0A0A8ZCZ8_ARUDO